jgi:GTPase SAR1 family protein
MSGEYRLKIAMLGDGAVGKTALTINCVGSRWAAAF